MSEELKLRKLEIIVRFRSFTDYASPTTRSIPDRSPFISSYSRIESGTFGFIALSTTRNVDEMNDQLDKNQLELFLDRISVPIQREITSARERESRERLRERDYLRIARKELRNETNFCERVGGFCERAVCEGILDEGARERALILTRTD